MIALEEHYGEYSRTSADKEIYEVLSLGILKSDNKNLEEHLKALDPPLPEGVLTYRFLLPLMIQPKATVNFSESVECSTDFLTILNRRAPTEGHETALEY